MNEVEYLKGNIPEVKNRIYQLSKMINKLDFEKVVQEVYEKNITLREYMKVPKNLLESLYAVGYDSYAIGDLNFARLVFEIICVLDAKEPRYYTALGMCYYLQKIYGRSLDIHIYALLLDGTSDISAFFSAECMFLLKLYKEADQMIAVASNNCIRSKNKKLEIECKKLKRKIDIKLTGNKKVNTNKKVASDTKVKEH